MVRGKREGFYNGIGDGAEMNLDFVRMDLYPSRLRKNPEKYFFRGFRQKSADANTAKAQFVADALRRGPSMLRVN